MGPSPDADPAPEPALIRTVADMHRAADAYRKADLRIALVPTMGYLHEGHLDLIRQAGCLADRVVVSIFVNPIQFGPREDLDRYPRDFERDRRLTGEAGGHAIYAPTPGEMYPEGYATYVAVERLTDHLCGAARPGHFRGVTTVVMKLFAAVKPHIAILGQKDGQQAGVIRRMTRDLNLDVEIVTAPTVREADGLAMSSRNRYLDDGQRVIAGQLNRIISATAGRIAAGSPVRHAVLKRLK